MIPLDLPEPGADEAAHSATVAALVRSEVDAAGGWLPFRRYMELVLYAPGLGYYSAGSAKFGRDGDFVTAPELSPVFGGCVADAVEGVLDELGGGAVLELGAGTGRLACDVLLELQRRGAPPRSYRILEVSADLRERQAAAVAGLPRELAACVSWLDRLPDGGHRGVVIANEVLDALPVERFRRAGERIEELGVVVDGEGFAWAGRPAGAVLGAAVAELETELGEPFGEGYASELSPLTAGFVAGLGAALERGALLLIDYGASRREYYAATRDEGTLACFYRHRVHGDPFVRVGLQDVTAWVDYTRVAEAALAADLEVAGYTTQAHFLIDTGFDRALAHVQSAREGRALHAATQAALTLVLPGEMGERYKCMALTRGVAKPRGFRGRDFTASL